MRFNEMAHAIINACSDESRTLKELIDGGQITYIPFPEGLKDKYQSYTQASIDALRNSGYALPMTSLEAGAARYVEFLTQSR